MIKSLLVAIIGLGFTFAAWAAAVNVNSASATELSENLSGVGETIAEDRFVIRLNGEVKADLPLKALSGTAPA